MVNLINIKRIKDIVVKAYFQAIKFEKDPTNTRAKEQFLNRVQKLAKLVKVSSYLSTQILKPLFKALKLLPFRGNNTSPIGTALISTALTNTAPTSIVASSITNNSIGKTNISKDPYKLNKLNARKLGFTKDREIIIGYKYKYFKKGNKKGQVYSKQVFVAIRLQACPYVKVLLFKDFTRNIVNMYLNCAYTIEASKRTKKDKFIKIVYTIAKSYKLELLKELAIYALYKQKEGNPI